MKHEDPWQGAADIIRRRLSSEQFAALDKVGIAYSKGKVSFDTAVECRDLIRAKRIDLALALLAYAQAESGELEVLP